MNLESYTLEKILSEASRRDLILNVDSARRSRSRNVSLRFSGVTPFTNTFYFTTSTGHESHLRLPIKSRPDDGVVDLATSIEEILFNEVDIEVHCTCPDYLYKGYQYRGTQDLYATRRELRFPKIKNPQLAGSVCKHLISLLVRLPEDTRLVNEMAEKLKQARKQRRVLRF